MTELVLTQKAAAELYAAPASLVVTSSAVKAVKPLMPDGVSLIALRADGVFHLPGEKGIDKASCVAMRGLPATMRAFIGGSAEAVARQSFLQFVGAVNPSEKLEFLTVKALPTFIVRWQVARFLSKLHASLLERAEQRLGDATRRLVQSRRANETLRMQVAQASRMIAAVGFNTRYVTVDLAPGNESLGPNGAVSQTSFSQILPVACAGLSAVSLYVISLPEHLSSDGYLMVKFSRSADGVVFSEHKVTAASLQRGWNSFPVNGEGMQAICDAVLSLEWQGADVLFALSDMVPDKFGSDKLGAGGRTLALQIQQGLPLPESLMSLEGQDGLSVSSLVAQTSKQVRVQHFPEISDSLSFYAGYEAHEKLCNKYQLPILTQNGETRVVQLHPLAGDLAAMVYHHAIPRDAVKIACEVGTAHANAPSFYYVLIAFPPSVEDVAETVEKVCRAASSGQLVGQEEGGVCWNAHTLAAQEKRFVELGLPLISEREPYHAAMAVLPIGGNTSYGWCRWYGFTVFTDTDALLGVGS